MYWFIGYVPRYQLKLIGIENQIYNIAYHMIRVFSIGSLIAGLIFTIIVLYKSIFSDELAMIFSVLSPTGIILGGLSLFFYLNKIQNKNST